MTASRKQTRTDLKAELATLMPSLPSDSFYRYEPADYGSKSPILFLRSNGAEHPRKLKTSDSTFFIEAHILTLYADYANETYQEEAATDLLDDLEEELSTAVDTKRVVANKWQDLAVEGRSLVDEQPVKGELYLHEVVLLRVTLF